MNQPIKWIASALSGLLLVACFPKANLHPLVWVAALPLFLVLANEPRPWRAFGWAYISGAVFFLGNCYWFVEVTRQYGGLSTGISLLVLLLFTLLDSVFFGGFGLVAGWTARRSPGRFLLLSPFLWLAMELARTYLLTGFPWDLLGYAVKPAGLRQVACITGVYGLSFLAAASSGVGAWVIMRWRSRGPRLATAAWIVLLLAGNWVLRPPVPAPGSTLAVLLQPNVPLDETQATTWAPWLNPAKLNRLVNMSIEALAQQESKPGSSSGQESGHGITPPPLIVWAENPAPFYFSRDPIFRLTVQQMARQANAYVVVNTVIPIGSGYSKITNSAIVIDPQGHPILQYDKIHLVPFGEYVPVWAFPDKISKITSEVGNFIPGNHYSVAPTPEGTIGVFICYEDIFPQLVRRITLAGAGVLVNVSNDAWYGDSAAAFQHLEMARLRAIENRRYLLRATNDGITVLIDPYGRVEERLPRHQAAVLPAYFRYRSRQTFYTRYGDVFAWGCAALSMIMLVLFWRVRGL